MCCFSRPVQSVSGTNIFARSDDGGRQFVVYSMTLRAKEELAMVLPLPVKQGRGEKAVTFIDLQDYPEFFTDLLKGFSVPITARPRSESRGVPPPSAAKLDVVSVGSFDASFVPTVADFARLDERFRLPPGTWDNLPQYRDFGFAVFKLKPGEAKVHPMAFSFPRANPHELFFPTVHIHDGKVHEKARFDHTCSPNTGPRTSSACWAGRNPSVTPALSCRSTRRRASSNRAATATNANCAAVSQIRTRLSGRRNGSAGVVVPMAVAQNRLCNERGKNPRDLR